MKGDKAKDSLPNSVISVDLLDESELNEYERRLYYEHPTFKINPVVKDEKFLTVEAKT